MVCVHLCLISMIRWICPKYHYGYGLLIFFVLFESKWIFKIHSSSYVRTYLGTFNSKTFFWSHHSVTRWRNQKNQAQLEIDAFCFLYYVVSSMCVRRTISMNFMDMIFDYDCDYGMYVHTRSNYIQLLYKAISNYRKFEYCFWWRMLQTKVLNLNSLLYVHFYLYSRTKYINMGDWIPSVFFFMYRWISWLFKNMSWI